jgi:hypothetical protein
LTGYFEEGVDFGSGLLVSVGGPDIFVAKLDGSGNHLWSKQFGDSGYQYGRSIDTDRSGNVIVAGSFGSAVDFGGGTLRSAGSDDLFVAKFDSSGSHLWSRRFGDTHQQLNVAIDNDSLGNVLMTAYFEGTADFGGGPLTSEGGYDIFVAKLEP